MFFSPVFIGVGICLLPVCIVNLVPTLKKLENLLEDYGKKIKNKIVKIFLLTLSLKHKYN